jgi:ABC-type microcin C transport system permease subunit YejE
VFKPVVCLCSLSLELSLSFLQAVKLPGYNKLSAMLTQAKKTEAKKWLSDVSSVALQ